MPSYGHLAMVMMIRRRVALFFALVFTALRAVLRDVAFERGPAVVSHRSPFPSNCVIIPSTYRTNRERGPMSEGVRVVLLPYHVYRALLDRVEDLEDLLAMREAEAEYRAGEGRPFDEIVAELEAEDRADVSG